MPKYAKRKPFEECTPEEKIFYWTPMTGVWDWYPSLRTVTRQEAEEHWGKFGYLPNQIEFCSFGNPKVYAYESRPKLWDENVTTA